MLTLYIVATPIGNLKDISERSKTVLAEVDVVLCEDTRVTHKLFDAINIKPKVMSYHQHSGDLALSAISELLSEGKNLALVTDAGTPTISDPGGKLVDALVKKFGNDLSIVPIPGPCALIAALSVSGFSADEFVFLGFPPNKKGRQTFFNKLESFDVTMVMYESTHRIFKTLEEIEKSIPDRKLAVCRELTKMYETIYRGTAAEVTSMLKASSIKGEFVIVISNKNQK